MKYTETKKAVNDELLTSVTGGDYGDCDTERRKLFSHMYNEGEYVEVYGTMLHWHTRRALVLKVKYSFEGDEDNRIVTPVYYVVYDDDGCHDYVRADDIERK